MMCEYDLRYTGWAKKVSLAIFAITVSAVSQFSYVLAKIHCRKFATGGCIVSPPNMAYVTTLPCKILTATFFTLNFMQKVQSPTAKCEYGLRYSLILCVNTD